MKTLRAAKSLPIEFEAGETFAPLSEWNDKMALLEEIHGEISPQVMALRSALDEVIDPRDLLDEPTTCFLNSNRP